MVIRITFCLLSLLLGLATALIARADGQLPTAIEQRIHDLAMSDDAQVDFQQLDAQGRLGVVYRELTKESEWLAQLQDMLGPHELLTRARQTVSRWQLGAIHYHQRHIDAEFIGDAAAYQQPSVIVVLGASEAVLEKRLELALPFARRFASIPLVLSGKGRGRGRITEAQQMETFLLRNAIASSRLFKEEESMDTIGNAIFSRLLLMQQRLAEPYRILLVTSAFQAPRALYLFQQAFGPSHSIAVALEKNATFRLPLDTLSANELNSQGLSTTTVLTLINGYDAHGAPNTVALTGDVCSQLYQLLIYDPQYASCQHLARHFQPICHPFDASMPRQPVLSDVF